MRITVILFIVLLSSCSNFSSIYEVDIGDSISINGVDYSFLRFEKYNHEDFSHSIDSSIRYRLVFNATNPSKKPKNICNFWHTATLVDQGGSQLEGQKRYTGKLNNQKEIHDSVIFERGIIFDPENSSLEGDLKIYLKPLVCDDKCKEAAAALGVSSPVDCTKEVTISIPKGKVSERYDTGLRYRTERRNSWYLSKVDKESDFESVLQYRTTINRESIFKNITYTCHFVLRNEGLIYIFRNNIDGSYLNIPKDGFAKLKIQKSNGDIVEIDQKILPSDFIFDHNEKLFNLIKNEKESLKIFVDFPGASYFEREKLRFIITKRDFEESIEIIKNEK